MPWDKHEHVVGELDADGDQCCTSCGLVLAGPALDEARELGAMLRSMVRP